MRSFRHLAITALLAASLASPTTGREPPAKNRFLAAAEQPRIQQLAPLTVLDPERRSASAADAKRIQAINVAGDVLQRMSSAAANEIVEVPAQLFADVNVSMALQRDTTTDGNVWVGSVASRADSSVVLSISGGELFGNIRVGSSWYQIRPTNDRTGYLVYDMDERVYAGMPEDQELSIPDFSPTIRSDTAFRDDASAIDVGVLYTPAAEVAAGGSAAIQNKINVAISETNQAYAASGVSQRIRLAYAAQTSYNENNTAGDPNSPDVFRVALNRLTAPSDGYMDEAHTLREQYAADVTALLIDGGTASCGLAWVAVEPSGGDPRYAFAVVNQSCATGYYSFGHEIGHNMGLVHDRANAVGATAARAYGYGYQQPGGLFRTIMAYANGCPGTCPRIQHFSNPNVLYNGMPTGVADSAANSADAARTLNETALTVANFRVHSSSPPPNPGSYTLTDHSMAQDVDNSGHPINRTSVFAPSDAHAYQWVQLNPYNGTHSVQFKFYAPGGSLFWNSSSSSVAGDGRSWSFWFSMGIAGTGAASRTGVWRADFLVDGQVTASDQFTIGSQNTSTCAASSTVVCLNGDRFAVSATWQTSDGKSGQGQATRLTAETGYFTFFDAGNVEVVIKVLNACSYNSRYWVFAGGLTDVNVQLTVRDTHTGTVKTYVNPMGKAFLPIEDTDAMATCP